MFLTLNTHTLILFICISLYSRHANLMLNLFSLMVDASVPDIALEPDKAVKKVQDKLRYFDNYMITNYTDMPLRILIYIEIRSGTTHVMNVVRPD